MCGIFAVSNDGELAGNLVVQGLKELEYRGYDSWGVATRQLDKVSMIKKVGKISQAKPRFAAASEAIGHTRWATHGQVTTANAHPQQAHRVTLVHNGVIENFALYKQKFPQHLWQSDTDTEIIAVLLDHYLSAGYSPLSAMQQVCSEIKGRFAIVVLIEGEPGIWAMRRGSPLIVGREDQRTFIASDIPAFLQHTNIVNYLDDNQLVHIDRGQAKFYSLTTAQQIQKRNITVPWEHKVIDKQGFPHFMLKEIFEQKTSIRQAIDHSDKLLSRALEILTKANGSYFIGCGTAHKTALFAKYCFAAMAGRKINVSSASEMGFFLNFVNANTAIVAVSQSGETADVMEILEQSQARGAKILALTNVDSSSMARLADVHLPLQTGPEKAVASTKATTAQLALLFLLSCGEKHGFNFGREILRSATAAINDLLNPRYESHVLSVAKDLALHNNLFIIGRGPLYPIALEAAIKIQEVSYIHAQGFVAGELKHGPIALIEKGTPCIVLGSDPETMANAQELKARGAKLLGISFAGSPIFDHWLKVPETPEVQAITTLVPVQILAYHLSLLRQVNPDMPRNLAKSVTVK